MLFIGFSSFLGLLSGLKYIGMKDFLLRLLPEFICLCHVKLVNLNDGFVEDRSK